MPKKKSAAPTAPEASAKTSTQPAAPAATAYVIRTAGSDPCAEVKAIAGRVLVLYTRPDPSHPDRAKSTAALAGAFPDVRHVIVCDPADTALWLAWSEEDRAFQNNGDIPDDVHREFLNVASWFVDQDPAEDKVGDVGDFRFLVYAEDSPACSVFTVGREALPDVGALAMLARRLGATVLDFRAQPPQKGPWSIASVRAALTAPAVQRAAA
jgi:hypothetical protein